MKRLRATKDLWLADGALAWPNGMDQLNVLLKPLVKRLDKCWWLLGGPINMAGAIPYQRIVDPNDPEFIEWMKKIESLNDDVDNWMLHGGSDVGMPGFFSRFGGGFDIDWHAYLAVDTNMWPDHLSDQLRACVKDVDLTADLPPLPPEVCVYARNIDCAYWEVFFRDEADFEIAINHLCGAEHMIIEPPERTVEARRFK